MLLCTVSQNEEQSSFTISMSDADWEFNYEQLDSNNIDNEDDDDIPYPQSLQEDLP